MTKILLVEDDKSLREIYGVRLLAEGYDIVTASDGEEALAVAIKERPALIITDIMMPKISGFDMLDILRSTTETKTIKVIMMTALSSDDQRARGVQMGADRYLVKSQVGIEDVVRTVHEVLGDGPTPPPATQATPPPPPAPTPVQPPAPLQPPPAPINPIAQPQQPNLQTPPAPPAPTASYNPLVAQPLPQAISNSPATPSSKQRIIQPLNDPGNKININELLDRELAKEAGLSIRQPQVATAAEEKAIVEGQIRAAEANQPASNQAPQAATAPSQPQPLPQPDYRAPIPAAPTRPDSNTPPQRFS